MCREAGDCVGRGVKGGREMCEQPEAGSGVSCILFDVQEK